MANKRPNILWIICDQLRRDTLGCFGDEHIQTPHIDQLVAQSVRFDNAYATTPICVPARAALLSGRYASALGGNLRPGIPSLADQLAAEGYHCAALGKMHFKPARGPYGFHHLRLAEDTGPNMFLDDYHPELAQQHLIEWGHGLDNFDEMWAPSQLDVADHITTWNGDEAVKYLRQTRPHDQPFFAVVSFVKPHPPFDPPEPYASLYDPAEMPAPVQPEPLARRSRTIQDWSDGCGWDVLCRRPDWVAAIRAYYYGLVTQIDDQVGRILAALDEENLAEETVVFFLSDHGEMLGDQHLFMKHFPYNGGLRIPLSIRAPGVAPGTCAALVNQIDLLPTVCQLTGTRTPANALGQNLLDLHAGRLAPRSAHVSLHAAGPNSWAALVDAQWKYHYYVNGGEEELFDMRGREQEGVNLAGESQFQDTCAALRRQATAAIAQIDATREPDVAPFLSEGHLPVLPYRQLGLLRNRYQVHKMPHFVP